MEKEKIKHWNIVLTTEDDKKINFEVNNDHITGTIDDFIKEQYEVSWEN